MTSQADPPKCDETQIYHVRCAPNYIYAQADDLCCQFQSKCYLDYTDNCRRMNTGETRKFSIIYRMMRKILILYIFLVFQVIEGELPNNCKTYDDRCQQLQSAVPKADA